MDPLIDVVVQQPTLEAEMLRWFLFRIRRRYHGMVAMTPWFKNVWFEVAG